MHHIVDKDGVICTKLEACAAHQPLTVKRRFWTAIFKSETHLFSEKQVDLYLKQMGWQIANI